MRPSLSGWLTPTVMTPVSADKYLSLQTGVCRFWASMTSGTLDRSLPMASFWMCR